MQTKTITLTIRVRALEHHVLADALAGDVERVLVEKHKVASARATSAKVNGREALASPRKRKDAKYTRELVAEDRRGYPKGFK